MSFTSGTFTTNCHLTDVLSTSLTRGRDFVRDYTSDIYERRDTAACRANNGLGSWDDGFQGQAYTKCSNFEMPGERLARSASRIIVAARDVADCEDQCLLQNRWEKHWRQRSNFISARFTCHAFAFRYPGASSIIGSGSTNCEMSDQDLRTVTSVAKCLKYQLCPVG